MSLLMLYIYTMKQTQKTKAMKKSEINSGKVEKLVKEYKADPNCWPALWISSEDLTQDEKNLFINRCVQK